MNTIINGRSLPAFASLAILAAVLPGAAHGQPQIDTFAGNGELSWSDPAGTGSNYAVEWAPTATGPWRSWRDAQASLTGLGATGTVAVPMFYRMVTPDPTYDPTQRYTYFEKLPPFNPLTPLETNEMRISFMGSMIPAPRRAQQEMSVFVEVGWTPDPNDKVYGGRAKDQFLFDCGSGVSANYGAMSVGYRRMDKVFINHLHADHMSDLSHIYCFGPSGDRKSPLYVWGPGPSGLESPVGSGKYYDDGTRTFCATLRAAMRWHTESFSFQGTRYTNYAIPTMQSWGLPVDPRPVGDDPANDAYALVPIELNWTKHGAVADDNVAYHNPDTGAKVTHFPVIHTRKGSIGYKLEWNGLSMIYTSDTKPETNSVHQAINRGKGVDVFVHEMVVPAEVWAYKNMGLTNVPGPTDPNYRAFVLTAQGMTSVQNSSHTPQGAFGHLLSRIEPKPKLTVATHFPVADDTVASALQSVRAHCTNIVQGKDIIWSFDLMVLRVFPDRIEQCRAVVSDFGFSPVVQLPAGVYPPKYHDASGVGDPFAQIDLSTQISSTNQDGTINYRDDGY
jgi:ribonuclease Z